MEGTLKEETRRVDDRNALRTSKCHVSDSADISMVQSQSAFAKHASLGSIRLSSTQGKRATDVINSYITLSQEGICYQ